MAFDYTSNIWQNPGSTNIIPDGPNSTKGFWRPNDSQMPVGNELLGYLTPNGWPGTSPDVITNRTVKYDGGLTREMMGNTTGFLSNQMGQGFGQTMTGMEDLFNQYGSLGGLGGIQNGGNASAVYRPNGGVFGAGGTQAANGGQMPFGQSNPFNATF